MCFSGLINDKVVNNGNFEISLMFSSRDKNQGGPFIISSLLPYAPLPLLFLVQVSAEFVTRGLQLVVRLMTMVAQMIGKRTAFLAFWLYLPVWMLCLGIKMRLFCHMNLISSLLWRAFAMVLLMALIVMIYGQETSLEVEGSYKSLLKTRIQDSHKGHA